MGGRKPFFFAGWSNFLTFRICCGMSSMTEGALMLGFVYLALPVPNTTGKPLNSSKKYLHIFEALENREGEGERVHEHVASCQATVFIQKYFDNLSKHALRIFRSDHLGLKIPEVSCLGLIWFLFFPFCRY